jgi:hypothetical protein
MSFQIMQKKFKLFMLSALVQPNTSVNPRAASDDLTGRAAYRSDD